MTGIRPYHAAVLALLAGNLAGGPADACCGGGGGMSKPSVPTPSVNVRPTIPRVDTSGATRGGIDQASRGTNGGDSTRSSGGGSGGGGIGQAGIAGKIMGAISLINAAPGETH